jgi:hypothetical protein
MLPLLLSTGIGAGYNRATAGVVVGGQTLSLVVTLLITPVAYTYVDDVARFFRWLFFRNGRTPEETGEAEVIASDEAIEVLSGVAK